MPTSSNDTRAGRLLRKHYRSIDDNDVQFIYKKQLSIIPCNTAKATVEAICEHWESAWGKLTSAPMSGQKTRLSDQAKHLTRLAKRVRNRSPNQCLSDSHLACAKPEQMNKQGKKANDRVSRKEFFRRIWTLVGVPLHYSYFNVFEATEGKIRDIVERVSPPHVPLAPGEFRLMRFEPSVCDKPIKMSLINIPLEKAGEDYSAVSYCWGPPTQARGIVIVNGKFMVVYASLLSLLWHFRDWATGLYSIYGLYIQQKDAIEKNAQIPLMPRIFSSPCTVDIWSGPDKVLPARCALCKSTSLTTCWSWCSSLIFVRTFYTQSYHRYVM